jgi:hypothetical protein
MISALPPSDGTSKQDEVRLLVNNGDLDLAVETVERLGFKDIASMFRFAALVLSQAATRSVTITTTDGQSRTLTPREPLLADNPKPFEPA